MYYIFNIGTGDLIKDPNGRAQLFATIEGARKHAEADNNIIAYCLLSDAVPDEVDTIFYTNG